MSHKHLNSIHLKQKANHLQTCSPLQIVFGKVNTIYLAAKDCMLGVTSCFSHLPPKSLLILCDLTPYLTQTSLISLLHFHVSILKVKHSWLSRIKNLYSSSCFANTSSEFKRVIMNQSNYKTVRGEHFHKKKKKRQFIRLEQNPGFSAGLASCPSITV
jgi:hypothetical protein